MAAPVGRRLSCLIVWCCCLFTAHAFIEGLYCGIDNCYDVLDVTREATKTEITKAYRKLAKKWHPDMHRTEADKETASQKFLKIANAYEILRDEEQRNDYNYMLDTPDEFYSHYYRYYRRRVTPKVDVRVVIAVVLTVISLVQYYGAWIRYQTALNYLCKEQRYRSKAMDIARSEGLLNTNKKKSKRSKEELKEEEEATIKRILADNMDIRGGHRKPQLTDILWVQLMLLPYHILKYIAWWVRWVWKFNIKREEYGREEKLYVIYKYMGLNRLQLESLEEKDIEEFLCKQLWIKENFKEWKEKKEEEMKSKQAEISRFKSYRRYLKKGGPGQMTFGPE